MYLPKEVQAGLDAARKAELKKKKVTKLEGVEEKLAAGEELTRKDLKKIIKKYEIKD